MNYIYYKYSNVKFTLYFPNVICIIYIPLNMMQGNDDIVFHIHDNHEIHTCLKLAEYFLESILPSEKFFLIFRIIQIFPVG